MGEWGRCNFSELRKLENQLSKISGKAALNEFFESCAKELAVRLLSKAVKRTPVGKKPELKGQKTVKVKGASGKSKTFLSAEAARIKQYWDGYAGGTLRRGWTSKTHEEAKRGGNVSVKAYVDSLTIKHVGNVLAIEIVNPVEYASYVEYGHRQKPGRFVPAIGKRLKKNWVNGRFMLTISEQEIKKLAPKLLEKKILEYLRRCFND